MAHRYKAELGSSLANFARVVPHGVLVFFPSSAALRSAYDAWERRGPDGGASVVERIAKHKTVVLEPREAAALPDAVAKFNAAVEASARCGVGGAMLLAVCRGRLSEGVDFSDAACRAVVITGLPLPPLYDPKVALKRRSSMDGAIA